MKPHKKSRSVPAAVLTPPERHTVSEDVIFIVLPGPPATSPLRFFFAHPRRESNQGRQVTSPLTFYCRAPAAGTEPGPPVTSSLMKSLKSIELFSCSFAMSGQSQCPFSIVFQWFSPCLEDTHGKGEKLTLAKRSRQE